MGFTVFALSWQLKAGHWQFLIVPPIAAVPGLTNVQVECSVFSKRSQIACHGIIMYVNFPIMVSEGGLNFAINTLLGWGHFTLLEPFFSKGHPYPLRMNSPLLLTYPRPIHSFL